MKDTTIDDQNTLIETIQSLGWDITASELHEYGNYSGDGVRGAEITLTVYKDYEDDEDDTDDNPYRVK